MTIHSCESCLVFFQVVLFTIVSTRCFFIMMYEVANSNFLIESVIAIQGVGHSNERRKTALFCVLLFFLDNFSDGMLFLLHIVKRC